MLETIKGIINARIKQNDNNEITGAILNDTLLKLVGVLEKGATFGGMVGPTDKPIAATEANTFYLTITPGLYTNFNSITTDEGLYAIIYSMGRWQAIEVLPKETILGFLPGVTFGGFLIPDGQDSISVQPDINNFFIALEKGIYEDFGLTIENDGLYLVRFNSLRKLWSYTNLLQTVKLPELHLRIYDGCLELVVDSVVDWNDVYPLVLIYNKKSRMNHREPAKHTLGDLGGDRRKVKGWSMFGGNQLEAIISDNTATHYSAIEHIDGSTNTRYLLSKDGLTVKAPALASRFREYKTVANDGIKYKININGMFIAAATSNNINSGGYRQRPLAIPFRVVLVKRSEIAKDNQFIYSGRYPYPKKFLASTYADFTLYRTLGVSTISTPGISVSVWDYRIT